MSKKSQSTKQGYRLWIIAPGGSSCTPGVKKDLESLPRFFKSEIHRSLRMKNSQVRVLSKDVTIDKIYSCFEEMSLDCGVHVVWFGGAGYHESGSGDAYFLVDQGEVKTRAPKISVRKIHSLIEMLPSNSNSNSSVFIILLDFCHSSCGLNIADLQGGYKNTAVFYAPFLLREAEDASNVNSGGWLTQTFLNVLNTRPDDGREVLVSHLVKGLRDSSEKLSKQSSVNNFSGYRVLVDERVNGIVLNKFSMWPGYPVAVLVVLLVFLGFIIESDSDTGLDSGTGLVEADKIGIIVTDSINDVPTVAIQELLKQRKKIVVYGDSVETDLELCPGVVDKHTKYVAFGDGVAHGCDKSVLTISSDFKFHETGSDGIKLEECDFAKEYVSDISRVTKFLSSENPLSIRESACDSYGGSFLYFSKKEIENVSFPLVLSNNCSHVMPGLFGACQELSVDSISQSMSKINGFIWVIGEVAPLVSEKLVKGIQIGVLLHSRETTQEKK